MVTNFDRANVKLKHPIPRMGAVRGEGGFRKWGMNKGTLLSECTLLGGYDKFRTQKQLLWLS